MQVRAHLLIYTSSHTSLILFSWCSGGVWPASLVMGGETKYQIQQNAYIKLVLHAIKHKTSAVNGILLGRLSGDGMVDIVDSVPLFHSQIGVLPPLEIALIMVSYYSFSCICSQKSRVSLQFLPFFLRG